MSATTVTDDLKADWWALRGGVPDSLVPLVVRLGAERGVWRMPAEPGCCPLCNGRKDEPGQRELDIEGGAA